MLTDRPDGDGAVTGTDLLVAVGRTPNTAGIGLERAGVELTGAGYIKVDEHLATTADRVWAMGECAGSRSSPTSPSTTSGSYGTT